MPANILLIEDDPGHRALVKFLLEHAGHTVRAVANGTHVLEMCREARPDLVISDLQLKGSENGYSVAKRIKQVPELSSIPMICISATYELYDVEEAKASGFNIFIPKPILPETFVPQIEFYLAAEKRCCPPPPR